MRFLQAGHPGTTTTLTALGYGRRLVYETTEVVSADFLL